MLKIEFLLLVTAGKECENTIWTTGTVELDNGRYLVFTNIDVNDKKIKQQMS